MKHPGDSQAPKILLLGSQMAVAGAQRVLLSQADWLAAHGYRVVVAFLYDRDGLQDRWQAGRDYPVINLRARRAGAGAIANALSFAGGIARLLGLMRRGKFTTVETFTHHSNLIGCPAAWLAGIPVRIASHHGRIAGMPALLQRLHAWMINLGIASRLVVVSRDVYHQSVEEGVKPQRLAMIPNGILPLAANPQQIDACRGEGLRQGSGPIGSGPLILAVGRLTVQKGHAVLLDALPAVLEKFPDSRLVILGEGPLRSELVAQAERLGISGHVYLPGTREDVAGWLYAADVFVLPSRSEGLPLALLEAMSAGRPIVATEVPGTREALDGGTCGLIVPMENPPALSAAILRLLEDCDYRQLLGQAAQKRFLQEYTLDTMMARYEKLLAPGIPGGSKADGSDEK